MMDLSIYIPKDQRIKPKSTTLSRYCVTVMISVAKHNIALFVLLHRQPDILGPISLVGIYNIGRNRLVSSRITHGSTVMLMTMMEALLSV